MLTAMLTALVLGVEMQATATGGVLDLAPQISEAQIKGSWRAYDGGLPVAKGDKGISLPYEVKASNARAFWDLALSHDLSRYDRFTFEFFFDKGQSLNPTCNVYFEAEGGWYSASFLVDSGWNSLSISKAEFGVEGSPAGWKKIKNMRVGGWKHTPGSGALAIASIRAVASPVAVIMGDRTPVESPEFQTVVNQSKVVSQLLEGAGIPSGGLTDTDVEDGALEGRKFAFFPHNPHMTAKEVEEVQKFVSKGGKVFAFYSVHPKLLELLGVQITAWRPQTRPGEYSSIKFDLTAVPDLPSSVKQASWNTNVIKTTRQDAKVVGTWLDSQGKSTDLPALALSDTGVYMAHILLADDLAGKHGMLRGLMGKFDPVIWEAVFESARKSASQIGEHKDLAEAKAALGAQAVQEAQRQMNLADLAKRERRFAEAVKLYGRAEEALLKAYLSAQPSKSNEFRAVWCHNAAGVPGYSWQGVTNRLAASGFNAVFPNMLWGGKAYYPSRFLPVDESVEKDGDQIKLCLEAARKSGIEVHVWKVNWNLINAPKSFIEQMRKEGRTQKDQNLKPTDWLCPSHLANYQLEKDSMLEVVKNYAVDGIHFDYIRYPGYEGCYCEGCRANFEKLVGAKVSNWPADVVGGPLKNRYLDFRRSNITRLVRAVSSEARRIRPGVKVSAAVFADWPNCRDSVGQDWGQWMKEGLLDIVCPMDYTRSNQQYQKWMEVQSAAAGDLRKFVPGVGVTLENNMGADQTAQQIQLGRKAGSKGFILFDLNRHLLEQTLPLLRLGVTKS